MTRFCILLAALLCLGADIAFGGSEPPPTLAALLEAQAPEPASDDEDSGFAGEKRRSAMRAGALAFGSQGGLARRGWEIARMLERHSRKLSVVYRFRDLMLHYHGFTVMPPVLAGTDRAFRLDREGMQAAGARRVLRIVEPERIVSAPPHWRDYLVREWPEAALPAPDPVPPRCGGGIALAALAAQGLGAGHRACRRHLRGRPGAAQPGVRGPGAVAPHQPGTDDLGARAEDRARGRQRTRAPHADRRDRGQPRRTRPLRATPR